MSDPARRVIFGREADAYESARPSYPAEAIEYIESLVSARAVLEVGAGTGKATEAMARSGRRLTCLEPSPEMADVLRAKELRGVSVVVASFEEWEGAEPHTMDLIFAAQAWHWVDPALAYRKALEMLRPAGALALVFNIPHERYEAFRGVYAEYAPELLVEHDSRIRKRDSATWLDDMLAAGFEDVDSFTHDWSVTLDPEAARTLYSTYSDHMLLSDDRRVRLLDGLAAAVERRGHVTLDYRTKVFSGFAP